MVWQSIPRLTRIAALVLCVSGLVRAEQTIGLFLNDEASYEGYTLFSAGDTYLINNEGLLVGAEFWPLRVIEVEPVGTSGGDIVWDWHVWDHLVQDFDPTRANFGVVADNPGLIDISYSWFDTNDWLHTNGIDYNEAARHAEAEESVGSHHNFAEVVNSRRASWRRRRSPAG
jgi:hypothetical protein